MTTTQNTTIIIILVKHYVRLLRFGLDVCKLDKFNPLAEAFLRATIPLMIMECVFKKSAM